MADCPNPTGRNSKVTPAASPNRSRSVKAGIVGVRSNFLMTMLHRRSPVVSQTASHSRNQLQVSHHLCTIRPPSQRPRPKLTSTSNSYELPVSAVYYITPLSQEVWSCSIGRHFLSQLASLTPSQPRSKSKARKQAHMCVPTNRSSTCYSRTSVSRLTSKGCYTMHPRQYARAV